MRDTLRLDLDEPGRFKTQDRLPAPGSGTAIMNRHGTRLIGNREARARLTGMGELQKHAGIRHAHCPPPVPAINGLDIPEARFNPRENGQNGAWLCALNRAP